MGEDGEGHISSGTMWLMVSVAGLVDFTQFILSFIPIVGWIITMILALFAEMGFLLWFKIKGVSYSKNPKSFLATWVIVPIIEIIPIVNALPSFTTGVLITCAKARAEEVIPRA
jgi:hypothetical protein